MDIWIERLRPEHLPLLERWAGRADGAVTPNDLPPDAAAISAWLDACASEPGRWNALVTVYDTPVGVAGLRRTAPDTAELSLLLGEVQYNLLRTATYAVLRMLDRAFEDASIRHVTMRVGARFSQLLEAFERMGFVRAGAQTGAAVCLSVEKAAFSQRKYLF